MDAYIFKVVRQYGRSFKLLSVGRKFGGVNVDHT